MNATNSSCSLFFFIVSNSTSQKIARFKQIVTYEPDALMPRPRSGSQFQLSPFDRPCRSSVNAQAPGVQCTKSVTGIVALLGILVGCAKRRGRIPAVVFD